MPPPGDTKNYIRPCRMMESSSQKPITPAIRKPTRPIIGISFHLGGMPDRTMSEEPMIRAARTMANEIRLED